MESDRKPKNLILVWETGTVLERPMKYPMRTKTEHNKSSSLGKLKIGPPERILKIST